MKSHTVAQLLATLGVTKSHSRPHVSNDNPFSESQFKTLKYRPEFPDRFGCHEDALRFLPRILPLVQRRALSLGHRPADAGDGPLRASSEDPCRPPRRALQPPTLPIRSVSSKGLPSRCVARRPCGSTRQRRPPTTTKKGFRKRICSQKPDAPLTHPRSGYPSSSCVPAELDSVSPDNSQRTTNQSPTTTTLGHPSHA